MCCVLKMGIILILSFLSVVNGFNVDIKSCVQHRSPNPGSMFGFTVAEHIENGRKWILVGAPKDNPRRRPGLERPGAVYRCDTERDNACDEIIFDTLENKYNGETVLEEKSGEWFGATLTSGGVDGPVVACAPRYVKRYSEERNKFNMRMRQKKAWDPVGQCFVATNGFTDITEYSPCRQLFRNVSLDQLGSCQAGFSAAISKDGRRLFLGAPGTFWWQGQVYSQSLDSKPVLLKTGETQLSDDDSYLGYSMVAGDFVNSGDQGLAVGRPKIQKLKGMVYLYTWDLQEVKKIAGEQIGAYFGYALAAGDIDGDGLDDIIIGAPMFTSPNNQGYYDVGKIYVVYQGSSSQRYFTHVHTRFGTESRARFGQALTSLRDINNDGYGDFAVGAPYGGPEGRGVVYIFNGGKNGVQEKASQTIFAEDVNNYMTTFGFSLSGGLDMDGNEYTDLVVGAYNADAIAFFKSRPVVKVTASVQYSGSKFISLDNNNCNLENGEQAVCTNISYCLEYDGIKVDQETDFELSFNLDAQSPKHSRMYFLNSGYSRSFNKTVTLVRKKMYCNKATVFIENEPRDKLTPLVVSMTYNLKSSQNQYGIRRASIEPVLDMTVGNEQKDSINIRKNCGPDNICIPNLKMQVTPSVDRYLLGSSEKFEVNVYVENSGEDAFETYYYLMLPPGVDYVKMERLEANKSAIPVLCSTVNNNGQNVVKCDIGNPLPTKQAVDFKIIVQPYYIEGMNQSYDFDMEVNSTNRESAHTVKDNNFHLGIGVFVDTNITLSGTSNPPDLHYNASIYKSENILHENDIGPAVSHIYVVRNNGPANVEEAEMFVMWPYQTLKGEDFFYVLLQPETSGQIQCEFAQHVNEKQVVVTDVNKSLIKIGLSEKLASEEERIVLAGAGGTSFTQSRPSASSWNAGSNRQSSASTVSGASSRVSYSEQGRHSESHSRPTMEWSKPPVEETFNTKNQFQASNSGRVSGGSYSSGGGSGSAKSQGSYSAEHRYYTKEAARLGHEGEAGSSFNRYGNRESYYGSSAGSGGAITKGVTTYNKQTVHNISDSWVGGAPQSWSTEETVNKDVMNLGSASFREHSDVLNGGTTYVGEAEEAVGLAAAAANTNDNLITGAVELETLSGSGYQGNTQGYRQQGIERGYESAQSKTIQHGYQGSQSGQTAYQGGGSMYHGASGSASYHGAGSSGYQGAASGGGFQAGRKSYQTQGGSYSSGAAARASYSASSSRQHSYSSEGSRQMAYTDRPAEYRWKRQAEEPNLDLKALYENCTASFKCAVVRCVTSGTLKAGEEVYLALRARINAKVLTELTPEHPLILSSLMGAKITRLPYVGRPENTIFRTAEARTSLVPQLAEPEQRPIPLWVVVLAAIVGAALLLLLIFILYKCGFFKRNRPRDTAERAPLNRNGYNQQDEHL